MAIWCTIRTFDTHARELGNDLPQEAIFFIKPTNCIHRENNIPLSSMSNDVHYETECVLKLDGRGGISHILVGLDLTDRTQQDELKSNKLPWARAKCFTASAVLGSEQVCPVDVRSLHSKEFNFGIRLRINGKVVQDEVLYNMSIPPIEQLESLHRWAPVRTGDYLFTGTPQGVGPLHLGDEVEAELFWKNGEVLSSYKATCV
ncbi:MAG: fumarylacetoacetate hydrolase family protein [archaeon]|nr:fumarylacetoacetate hydrolase family protein [archaeon]